MIPFLLLVPGRLLSMMALALGGATADGEPPKATERRAKEFVIHGSSEDCLAQHDAVRGKSVVERNVLAIHH